MTRSSEEDPPRSNVSDAVLSAVVDSYYPDVARAGTTARARAQAAQSVATVFATTLVAGLTLTDIRHHSPLIRILSCLAVLSWAVAALLYMRAVGTAVRLDERITGVNDADQLVRIVLERAKIERDDVDRRLRWANVVSVLALALTAAVFIGLAFSPTSESTKAAILSTTEEQTNLLRSHCSLSGTTITGFVNEASLQTATLEFTVNCGEAELHMSIPRADVRGLIILER